MDFIRRVVSRIIDLDRLRLLDSYQREIDRAECLLQYMSLHKTTPHYHQTLVGYHTMVKSFNAAKPWYVKAVRPNPMV